jgi:hypothetical protein
MVRSRADGCGKAEATDRYASARQLSGILLEGLTALAGAGEVETACRLAGRACVALRLADPKAARQFDILLHRLTPKLTW